MSRSVIYTDEVTFDEAVEVYLAAMDSDGALFSQPSESSSDIVGGVWHLKNQNGPLGFVGVNGASGLADGWKYFSELESVPKLAV